MDTSDLLAIVRQREAERELCDALALGAGDDLEGLDDAVDGLVLEAGVLALGVLADDAEVDVLVAGLVAGDVLDEDDGGVDVEFLAEGDVEGDVAAAGDGGVKDACWSSCVSLLELERCEAFAPFRPILFLRRLAIDSLNSSSVCLSPDSMPETSICSHSTGTLSALNIVFTISDTSAPIPSPCRC